ncbi:hypothetical protein NE659_27520, partial [Flavonifractor plautii]|nr:hypothetical protein [Flavonifractor plautii]
MEKNGGMSGGEIESEIIKDYVMSLPPEERAAAGWTLLIQLINKALCKAGAPANLVVTVSAPSIENTNAMM